MVGAHALEGRLLGHAGLDRAREGANVWFALPPDPNGALARDLVARLPADGGGVLVEVEREIPAGPNGDALVLLREWTPSALAQELEPRFTSLARRAEGEAFAPVRAAFAG